jgi:competence protein ComEA
MKDWWKIAFSVVCSFLGVGIILLVSSQPRGQPITLGPPPTSVPIIIYITGAVVHPGVYSLSPDSRVQDAIQAAGGTSSDADLESVNLADFLEDGNQLSIPTKQHVSTSEDALPTPIASRGGNETPILPNPGELININTANQAELESLPGIGPVLAQRIIAYREANGSFASIDDILDVFGIGQSTFEMIKDLIAVK